MPGVTRERVGFTLLEALVALFIMALVMMLGYAFMMRQPLASQRLAAGDEALRALEASLESLRSGVVALEPGMLQPVIAYPPPTKARGLLIDLEVEPTEITGLFAVTLAARYRVGRAIHSRQLHSLIWSPG